SVGRACRCTAWRVPPRTREFGCHARVYPGEGTMAMGRGPIIEEGNGDFQEWHKDTNQFHHETTKGRKHEKALTGSAGPCLRSLLSCFRISGGLLAKCRTGYLPDRGPSRPTGFLRRMAAQPPRRRTPQLGVQRRQYDRHRSTPTVQALAKSHVRLPTGR